MSIAQDNVCGLTSEISCWCGSVTLLFHGLTRVVDGIQGDSPGSDETSNPFQLASSYIVLENNVIGEVDAADRLQRRALAVEWDTTVLALSLDSQGLGYGALIVPHFSQDSDFPLFLQKNWQSLATQTTVKFDFLKVSKMKADSLKYMGNQLLSCRKISQCGSLAVQCLWCVDSGAVPLKAKPPHRSLYTLCQAILRCDTSQIQSQDLEDE